MKVFAETERFILRELLPSDVDGMFELDADPEVHKYLGNKTVSIKDESAVIISTIRQQYLDYGIGRWAVVDKKTEEFVGWCGIKFITEETNNHINFYDIGYRLQKRFWGKGIATETASACLKYAFEELDFKEVYALTAVDNAGSNKILKKIGMRFIENFDYHGEDENWYRIERKDFFKKE